MGDKFIGILEVNPKSDCTERAAPFYLKWEGKKIAIWARRKGRHNWAGARYDIWFRYNQKEYHGTLYGYSNIVHISEVKPGK